MEYKTPNQNEIEASSRSSPITTIDADKQQEPSSPLTQSTNEVKRLPDVNTYSIQNSLRESRLAELAMIFDKEIDADRVEKSNTSRSAKSGASDHLIPVGDNENVRRNQDVFGAANDSQNLKPYNLTPTTVVPPPISNNNASQAVMSDAYGASNLNQVTETGADVSADAMNSQFFFSTTSQLNANEHSTTMPPDFFAPSTSLVPPSTNNSNTFPTTTDGRGQEPPAETIPPPGGLAVQLGSDDRQPLSNCEDDNHEKGLVNESTDLGSNSTKSNHDSRNVYPLQTNGGLPILGEVPSDEEEKYPLEEEDGSVLNQRSDGSTDYQMSNSNNDLYPIKEDATPDVDEADSDRTLHNSVQGSDAMSSYRSNAMSSIQSNYDDSVTHSEVTRPMNNTSLLNTDDTEGFGDSDDDKLRNSLLQVNEEEKQDEHFPQDVGERSGILSQQQQPSQSGPRGQERQNSSWRSRSWSLLEMKRASRYMLFTVVVLISLMCLLLALYLPGKLNKEDGIKDIRDKSRNAPSTNPPRTNPSSTKPSLSTSTSTTMSPLSTPISIPPTSVPNNLGEMYVTASNVIIRHNVSEEGVLGQGGCTWNPACMKSNNGTVQTEALRTSQPINQTIHQQALFHCVSNDDLLLNKMMNHHLNQEAMDEEEIIQCYIINIFALSLGMDSWNHNEGWSGLTKNSTCGEHLCTNECSWHGIHCTKFKSNFVDEDVLMIVGIDLHDNELNGTLPPEIWKLPKLESLKLYGNVISGDISGLASSRSLRHIWIENEKEKGNLTGRIPSEIGLLTTLEKLHLGNNQLEGTIPTEIKNLKSLEAIDLHDNALNGTLPPEIWKLPKLESLKLYGNVISGDISGLASSTSLRHIWIENEKEKGNLTGSIPSEIGLLTNLEKLYLGNNQLEGTIPTEIKNLKSLEAFSVFDNNISGPFPNEFMNRNKLQRLFLEKNKLTGGIHSSFGLQLQNLTDFRAYSNNLTGTIPTSLQAMNQLKVLYLDNNEFTGELIRALDWSNLVYFDMSNNNITGTLPYELFQAPELKSINLMGNNINSTIPSNICKDEAFRNLEQLELSKNELIIGTLPDSLKYCTNLKTLSVGVNKLSGTIPDYIGDLKKLTNLFLDNNKFTGEIPQTLSLASELNRINLSNNNLTGQINDLLCNSVEEIIVDCEEVECSCCCSR